jgi:hypothetical protein
MKNLIIIIVLGIAGFASCKTEKDTLPQQMAVLENEGLSSVGAIGTGTTSLTFAVVKGRLVTSGNLETKIGFIYNDTLSLLQKGISDAQYLDTMNMRTTTSLARITRLKQRTKYYYRFVATNFKGVSYSRIDSFDSAPRFAACTLANISPFGADTAVVSATLTNTADETVENWGICYGLGQNPDITDEFSVTTLAVKRKFVNSDTTVTVRNLLPNRNYYFRAFTKNRGGTFYSPQRSILTPP